MEFFVRFFLVVLFVILSAAFLTILERKILASVQRRQGPNAVGFFGLLQSIADALKLLTKEVIFPKNSDKFLFLLAPIIIFLVSITLWVFIPFDKFSYITKNNLSVLLVFFLSTISTYSALIAGTSSRNKYAFLASIRSISLMLSYELILFISVLPLINFYNSLDLLLILEESNFFFFLLLLPFFLSFLIGILVETNRAPFDLPEAEGELISGFTTEYSSVFFTFFFLAEYLNLLFFSYFLSSLFFKSSFFIVFVIIFFFCWVRATFPRVRFDQFISYSWLILIPLVFSFLVFSFFFYWFFLFIDFNFFIY